MTPSGFRGNGSGAIAGYGIQASGNADITIIVSACTGRHPIRCTVRIGTTDVTMNIATIMILIGMMMINAATVADL